MTNMVLGDSTLEFLTLLSVNALLKIEVWTLINDVNNYNPPMCATKNPNPKP
jgi:hypothetical protein